MATYYLVETAIRIQKEEILALMRGDSISTDVQRCLLESLRSYCLDHYFVWKEGEEK